MSDGTEKKGEGEDQGAAGKVRELVESIREEIGRNNTDLQAKLDEMTQRREEDVKDLGKVREELAAIQAQAKEREATIREIERRNNLRLDADPVHKREQALAILGAMTRRELARAMKIELPERFDKEREMVDTYMRERMERATLAEITTQGGYMMPTVLVLDIYDTLEEVSALLGQIDFMSGVPSKGSYVTMTGRPTLQTARASSDTAMTQSDPTFGQYTWDTDEAYIYFPVDNWILQLSPIQIGQKLIQVARDGFIGGMVDWLINADGTASYNSNTGILNDTVNVISMAGTTFESLTNADLRKLMRGVLVRARRAGAFLGGPYAIDVLEDIERTGKVPILREVGDGYVVKGKRFVEDESMPDDGDSAAATGFMGFGDLKTWAVVLAGAGLQIASDSSYRFAYNQTAFRATGHVDIVRKPGNTWALLKTKAA